VVTFDPPPHSEIKGLEVVSLLEQKIPTMPLGAKVPDVLGVCPDGVNRKSPCRGIR
jgi:hypothetical protein